ncbi:S1/P1 nuclease [Glaciecola petra]|uniref:S1/P1 nuclease n=1 Tax=Glaciecola petra TaxID=3075602 RepID=A0ABU2ZTD6_9ALTE|nr:S1/P1 nuclease [Aestuariibacter sp. P117]MDT0595671.1 S1/P1 nuclease [Aestuariibacter sp. P117]
MKILKTAIICVIVAINISINDASAWGQTGHRVTGEIAEKYLTVEAKAAIQNILENQGLAEISTYADEMRSNPEYFWQEVAGPFHYVTVPLGKTYSDVGAPEEGDSVTAIKRFSKILKDSESSKADKQLALKMLVHIIGDLHQPLHAGNGTDRGGNDRKLKFFWEESNLHRVWDSGLIDRRQLSYTEWTVFLAAKITPEKLKAWQTTDPLVYIAESAKIRDKIYPESDDLSWQYLYKHAPTVKQRLSQAGVRIAAHLNDIFSD